jgi:hypothetical protein
MSAKKQKKLLAAIREAELELEQQEALNAKAAHALWLQRNFISQRQVLMRQAAEATQLLEEQQAELDKVDATSSSFKAEISASCDELSRMQFRAVNGGNSRSQFTQSGNGSGFSLSTSGEGEADALIRVARDRLRSSEAVFFDVKDSFRVLSESAREDCRSISMKTNEDSMQITQLQENLLNDLPVSALKRYLAREQLEAELKSQRKRINQNDFDRLKHVALLRAVNSLKQKYHVSEMLSKSDMKLVHKEYNKVQLMIPRIHDLLESVFDKQCFDEEARLDASIQERLSGIKILLQELAENKSFDLFTTSNPVSYNVDREAQDTSKPNNVLSSEGSGDSLIIFHDLDNSMQVLRGKCSQSIEFLSFLNCSERVLSLEQQHQEKLSSLVQEAESNLANYSALVSRLTIILQFISKNRK